MKIKFPGAFLLYATILILFLFPSCVPVTPIPTETPSATSPAGVTITPMPGDLGWGAVHGTITDSVTGLPVEGAAVKCEHVSYSSPVRCNATTTTNAEGIYSFSPVFFHDTDRITLSVEAPGYLPLRFEQSFFTQPDFRADLSLFTSTGDTPGPTPTPIDLTPTPYLMCTPPPCDGGVYTCGNPNGCPGGCGTICLTATPYVMCTPPPCDGGTYACGNSNGCPGGCGTICLTATPKP